jgi:hypothetical protein
MTLSEFFCGMVVFAFGGLFGSLVMVSALLDEMYENLPGMSWRAKSVFCRFFGFFRLAKTAMKIDAGFRESYAYTLVGVMADFGGPRPIPQTKRAMDALLEETERRFQAMLKARGLLP